MWSDTWSVYYGFILAFLKDFSDRKKAVTDYLQQEDFMKTFKRFAAALLLVCLLAGHFSLTSVEAALPKTTGLKFVGWYDEKCTKPVIKWSAAKGAQLYEVRYMYTDNSNIKNVYTTDTSGYLSGFQSNRIYKIMVRALKVSKGKIASQGRWSDVLYTIPVPVNITPTAAGNTVKAGIKFKWNQVKGSNGYYIYMATNPKGKWYQVKATTRQGTTTATVTKINGNGFRKNRNYYYRIVTRKVVNGKVRVSPLPSRNYYVGSVKWN